MRVLSVCERCGSAYDAVISYGGCCSAECAAATLADAERRVRARSRRFVAIVAALLLMAGALWGIGRIGSTLALAAQMEAPAAARKRLLTIAEHQRKLPQIFALQQSSAAIAVAAINTPDGTSEFSFPTVRTFCEALRLEGQAFVKHSKDEAAARADAIVAQFGAQQLPDGEVVEVVRNGLTTCNGSMHRLPVYLVFVRDARLRISGWVLLNHLSSSV